MALVVKGTTVKKLVANGTTCKKGICNGTTVFSSELVIYQNGTIDSEVGGFTKSWSTAGASLTTSSTYLCVDRGNADNNVPQGYWRSNVAIDLTNYTTLSFTAYTTGWGNFYVGFDTVSSNWDFAGGTYPAHKTQVTATSATNYTLDISGLTGKYYLWFTAHLNTYSTGKLYVNNIKLA